MMTQDARPEKQQQLQRLIQELHEMIQAAERKVEQSRSLDEISYWRGVLFGLQWALHELNGSATQPWAEDCPSSLTL